MGGRARPRKSRGAGRSQAELRRHRACIAAGDRTEQYTIVVTLFEGTKLSESVARVHRMSSEDIEAKHAGLSR